MKKILVVLTIICIGLACYTGYEFYNMTKVRNAYEEKVETYKELIINTNANEEKIIELQNELDKVIEENSNSNKEYKIWTSLIDQLKKLLQD